MTKMCCGCIHYLEHCEDCRCICHPEGHERCAHHYKCNRSGKERTRKDRWYACHYEFYDTDSKSAKELGIA